MLNYTRNIIMGVGSKLLPRTREEIERLPTKGTLSREKQLNLNLSDVYRKARRNSVVISSLSIAWSLSQINIKSFLSFGEINENSSVLIILLALVLYSIFRMSIEYLMQDRRVRRWKLAKIDFSVAYYIAVFSVPSLLITMVVRSIYVSIFIIFIAVMLAVIIPLFEFLGTIIIMPALLIIRKKIRKGPVSVANTAMMSMGYSYLITLLVIVISFFYSMQFIYDYHFLLGLDSPPSLGQTLFLTVMGLVIFIWIKLFNKRFLRMLFDHQEIYTMVKCPTTDGEYAITWEENPDYDLDKEPERETKANRPDHQQEISLTIKK